MGSCILVAFVFKKNQNMPSGAMAVNDLLKVMEFIA
jgi:hypothetical protein